MAKEYIERGKLKDELIDLTPYAICGAQINSDIDMYTVMTIIDEQTVFDVVEVVRCKDCRYWTGIDEFGDGLCNNPSGLDDVAQPCDFCSYGKRRDNHDYRERT